MDKKKKILIIDDSALMRRINCDIIATDDRFCVEDMAANGIDGLELLKKKNYDAVVLDVVMPKLDGIGVLKEIKRLGIRVNVVVFSSKTAEGTETTLKALELGAFDFIHKPDSILTAKTEEFISHYLSVLDCAASNRKKKPSVRRQSGTAVSPMPAQKQKCALTWEQKNGSSREQKNVSSGGSVSPEKNMTLQKSGGWHGAGFGSKIVAIASSTGGPKALQEVIPLLPADLDAPVLVVQHMPAGFTASLAQRLDELSPLHVQEAEDGMEICKGNVYIAKGGLHMEVAQLGSRHIISLKDGPAREGVRPCANFMYETLGTSGYEKVICVVLTGMGADGTEGIQNLSKQKNVYVIAQEESTCAVYGMPKCIVATGMTDQIEPIDNIASAIISNAGVQ